MSLSALDLNLLLVLDTVLGERSVARAARRLHVTPSAVSNALARLRVALGDPLVTRSGRGIVATPRAAALAPALARGLRELEQVVAGDSFDAATSQRELCLALADVGQVAHLPRLAELLAKAMPQAQLRVVGIDTLAATGGLGGTAVDVSIGRAEAAPGIHRVALYREPLVLVLRRGHPRARGHITKTQLQALRHVDVQLVPGRSNRDLVTSYVQRGITREVALVVPSFTAAAAIVAATDHAASLPASLVDVLGPGLGLRRVSTPVPALSQQIYMSWHQRTHHDPALRLLRELITRTRAGRVARVR